MGTTEPNVAVDELGVDKQTQDIKRSLKRIERRDWTLSVSAIIVILSLTAAILTFSLTVLSRPDEPFFQFHMSQSVRGLVGLVLIFSVYTIYQQIHLSRLRRQLEGQIGIASREHYRAEAFMKLAMLDPLTNLHNRRFAEERLKAEVARSKRTGRSLAVAAFDLDEFKRINDQYGHAAGDVVLKTFGERLSRTTRGSDLGVRMGGDEFLLILPECAIDGISQVLKRLQSLEVNFEGVTIRTTFSVGWTLYQPGETPEQLLQRADAALYVDKRKVRNPA